MERWEKSFRVFIYIRLRFFLIFFLVAVLVLVSISITLFSSFVSPVSDGRSSLELIISVGCV